MEPMRSPQIVVVALLISLVSCAEPATTALPAQSAVRSKSRVVGTQPVVTFPEVRNETSGIAAEHAWIHTHYPGYQWSSRQILEDDHGHVYHRVVLMNPKGRRATVYFEVTRWFDQL